MSYYILASSHVKSGTILVTNIIRMLTDLSGLKRYINENADKIIDVKDFPEAHRLSCGSVSFMPDNKIKAGFMLLDINNVVIGTHAEVIDNDRILPLCEGEGWFAVEHASPGTFFQNGFAASCRYKIFVSRDFRDVYNSMTKFVSFQKADVSKIDLLDNYTEYQKFSYLNISMFHHYLSTWKTYTSEYLEHKDDMYLLKYEDLMSQPAETIRKLADYLDCAVTDETIESVISALFNKNLIKHANSSEQTKKCRHFSGSEKRHGEWRIWFNRYMADAVKSEAGKLLVELGYENDNSWDVEEPEDEAMKFFRKKLDSVAENYAAKSMFTKAMYEMAKGKSAVVYGAGLYAAKLLKGFESTENIKFIVDDNPEKWGRNIEGVLIVSPSELVKRFMDYDIIFIAVHPQYYVGVIEKILEIGIEKSIMVNAYSDIVDMFQTV